MSCIFCFFLKFFPLFSAAFVIAYIMETFGMKYRDAFSYVQERRFCINPNAGFVHQLQVTFLFFLFMAVRK
uniref:Dual specificity phosphatase catalytic domain-containing protein n=1 Tax=Equus asinus asinus TaxID=83772 RepID=A0A8C4PHE7_EQUAS